MNWIQCYNALANRNLAFYTEERKGGKKKDAFINTACQISHESLGRTHFSFPLLRAPCQKLLSPL